MFAHPYACQSETNTIRNRVRRATLDEHTEDGYNSTTK